MKLSCLCILNNGRSSICKRFTKSDEMIVYTEVFSLHFASYRLAHFLYTRNQFSYMNHDIIIVTWTEL